MDIDRLRLSELIEGRAKLIFAPTQEEDDVLSLVREHVLRNVLDLQIWTIVDGLRDGLISGQPPIPDTTHPAAALLCVKRQTTRTLTVFLDLIPHLRDERTLRMARDVIAALGKTQSKLMLIDHQDELPAVLASGAVRFELSLPGEVEIEDLIRTLVRAHHREQPIQIDMRKSGFQALVRNLRGLHRRAIRRIIEEAVCTDRRLDEADLNTALVRKRQMLSSGGLLEFVDAPVDLSEVAGMRRLKHWLKLRQNALTSEAILFGITPPRGVLLLGVQGAGKSFCAKAIATAWQRPLLRLDVGALYDKYIGESERRLRDAFRQAEAMAPIILWVDEIEKGFASAASRSTDGGLSQRMFGELLTWMQEHRSSVFLVATANDIEALPPELLRKGRFDEIFFVDLPCPEARHELFAVHLRKRHRDPPAFDLARLVDLANGYSGAEIEQAVLAALHHAFEQGRDLCTDDLADAIRISPPLSVTMAERVAVLRAWAANRCMPAD